MKNEKGGGSARLLAFILTDMMSDVEGFHRAVVKVETPPTPRLLTPKRHEWAANFLNEELNEYCVAWNADDLPGAVDALVDLIYVAMGRLLEMGIPPSEAWDPVQRANMAKERGMTHRGSDTDAAKPEGWLPPDHESLIRNLTLRGAVSESLLEATAIRLERGAAYNKGSVRREDHFPLGTTSLFDAMWLKMIRMRSDVEAGHPINRDHPRDLINYADFMLCLMDGREM